MSHTQILGYLFTVDEALAVAVDAADRQNVTGSEDVRLREAKLLFGPLHYTLDKRAAKVWHGGYDLILTDQPGAYIVRGPAESVPGTKGGVKGNVLYTVTCFLSEPGLDSCECHDGEYHDCKHVLAVRIQVTKARQIYQSTLTPSDLAVLRRLEDAHRRSVR